MLDFVPVMDLGYGRICTHAATGFTIATAKRLMASGDLTQADIVAFLSEHISPDVAPRPSASRHEEPS